MNEDNSTSSGPKPPLRPGHVWSIRVKLQLIGRVPSDQRPQGDTIGAIYDCALEPDRWQATIVQIANLAESSVSAIHRFDAKSMQSVRIFDHGIEPHYLKLVHEIYAAICPLYMPLFLRSVGDPATRTMLCDDELCFGSRSTRSGSRLNLGMLTTWVTSPSGPAIASCSRKFAA